VSLAHGLVGSTALFCGVLIAADLTPAQKQLNIDSFEHVWSTVRESHWDPKLGGLDWKAVHDELRPVVEKAATMAEARKAMGDMLGRLHESHFAVIPGDVYRDVNEGTGAGADRTGIDVRVVNGAALVTSVEEGSPAANAGVRRGWQILQVRGKDVAPTIEAVDGAYRNSTLRDMMLSRAVAAKLGGDAGERVGVRFLDGAGKTVDLEIGLAPVRGEITRFGNLPPQHVWIESRTLHGNVGYIAFNMFLDPARLMAAFEEAVKSFQKSDGCRDRSAGESWGDRHHGDGDGGLVIEKQSQQLGTMTMRQTPLHFVVNPRIPPFRGRVAILVDGCSASTSEIFAWGDAGFEAGADFRNADGGGGAAIVYRAAGERGRIPIRDGGLRLGRRQAARRGGGHAGCGSTAHTRTVAGGKGRGS
jgi:carboxyl-terminal processing protease